jgi:hypothetical protein
MSVNDPELWQKEFPITSVTRADLTQAGFAKAFVATITDEQMQMIASKMEDSFCDTSYWTDLKMATIAVTAKEGGSAGD